MNEQQAALAAIIRDQYADAHATALVADVVSDGVFALQSLAEGFADYFAEVDRSFNRREFLAAAIDRPGIENQWEVRP